MSTQLSMFAPTRRHDGVALRSFHSRKPIPGPASEAAQEIKRGEGKARQQEEAIIAFYREQRKPMSPSQVWMGLTSRSSFEVFLLTSVRRGITNLTTMGLLQMTRNRRRGLYGSWEHLWELVPAEGGNQ